MEKANNFKRLIIKIKNKPKNLLKYAKYLEKWLQKYILQTTAQGYCIGLSGGIDSSLTLAILAQLKNLKILGLFIDIESSQQDIKCVENLKNVYQFDYLYINLTNVYKTLVAKFDIEDNQNAKNNLKVRLRMATLYAYANKNNLLVCGTSNADERLVGYYTKFGDGACDINPIYWLLKSQIKFLALMYKVPNEIIDRKPSAGLYEGQTDEKDLGISYEEIDHYLCYSSIDLKQENKIFCRYLTNKHKSNCPSIPKKFIKLRNNK